MAIEFGFGLGEEKDTRVIQGTKKRYQDLSDKDKEFYYNGLPWLLMATGIPVVTKDSIPQIMARHKLNPILTMPKNCDDVERKFNTEMIGYLEKFIGYKVGGRHSQPMGDREFLAKIKRINKLDMSEKKICELQVKTYCEMYKDE